MKQGRDEGGVKDHCIVSVKEYEKICFIGESISKISGAVALLVGSLRIFVTYFWFAFKPV